VIAGAAAFVAAQGALLLAARGLLARVRTGNDHVDLVLLLLLRLGLMSAVVLAAGLLGGLGPLPLGAAGVVGTAIGLAAGLHRTDLGLRMPRAGWTIGALAALVVLRLLLQAWFFAPYTGDVLAYHLPKVAEWVRAGRLTGELGLDNHGSFPAGFELIEVWWTLFWRHDVLIEAAGLEFLALAAASVYSLSRSIGVSEPGAGLAALAAVLSPGLHHQATSCLNDGPTAALFVASAALLVARVPDVLVLLPVGLGLGVKPTFAYAVPGLLLLRHLVRREPMRSGPSTLAPRLVAAGAVTIGLAWYARNLFLFGNPIHPVGTRGLVDEGGTLWIQAGPRLTSLWDNLRALVNVRISDGRNATGALLENVAGWGIAAFACGLPAVLALAPSERPLRRLALAALASLACVLCLAKPDPWCLRFVLFVPAILAVAAARMAETMPRTRVALGFAVVVQFLGTFLPAELPGPAFVKLARQPWATRALFDPMPPGVDPAAVGAFGGNDAESYLLYRPDFGRAVFYLRSPDADALRADLRRAGVAWLYAAPSTASQRKTIEAACSRGFLKRAADRIYRFEDVP
jgi:hypothetical protein